MGKFIKGGIPWNKGLTKETNSSMAIISKKLKGKKIGFKKGYTPWNKGKILITSGTFKKKDKRLIGNKFRLGKTSWNKNIKGKYSHSYGHKDMRSFDDRRKHGIMGRMALQNNKGMTSIERIIFDYLRGLKIEFESQKLINKRFLVDFYVEKSNLIIEADGRYWHSFDKTIKKDRAENAYLIKCGFNLLRLQEDEILNGQYERRLLEWL